VLRVRCPEGLQLTRRFAAADPVARLYAYVDSERLRRARAAADPEEAQARPMTPPLFLRRQEQRETGGFRDRHRDGDGRRRGDRRRETGME
jgi:hypothetical protein